MNNNYKQYFNQDLAQQLRSYSWELSSRYIIPDEEILCANMFISIFVAGDRFECNNHNILNHLDITEYVAQNYPPLRELIPYYCNVFNLYRNYAWKFMCGNISEIRKKSFLVEKFFEWLSLDSDIVYERAFVAPDDSSIWNQQFEVEYGDFILFQFAEAYIKLVKDNDVIILPKSKRIIRLKGITIDNILIERNRFFDECAKNTEEFIANVIEELDKED